jgi:DNA-binding NarL/FixJ family response regulator
MPIRVLIANAHQVIRVGLCTFLENEKAFEIVGQAKDGYEALALVRQVTPDVVALDASST